jgi:hypothetical protein
MHEVHAAAYLAEAARNARSLAMRVSPRDKDDDRCGKNGRIRWDFREARTEQTAVANTLARAWGLVDVLAACAVRMLFARLAASVRAVYRNNGEISRVAIRRGSAIAAVRHYSWQHLNPDNREAAGVGSEVRA